MCWTITIGTGALPGRALMILPRASGPPVEEPIATMSILRRTPGRATATGAAGAPAAGAAAPADGRSGVAPVAPPELSFGRRLTTRTPAIVFTVLTISD